MGNYVREHTPFNSGNHLAEVNGVQIAFTDPVPQGRQILSEAGYDPADEHLLIQLLHHETRSVSLDEMVDLRTEGAKNFMAFRNDRIFRFTINDRGYEWGTELIGEPMLRRLAGISNDAVLVLESEDGEVVLEPYAQVNLSESGTEHIQSKSRYITVSLNGDKREIPRGIYTMEQLIVILPVEPGYVLNLLDADGKLTALKSDEKLRVKEGMKFFSQVPCGASS
ncbi:MAG: multiubiquitin domain-containing protein [Candidatus Melainabacteria bacterium]|nr:multiubiquitin domain-containing protein [Candidatus Melainabacteria bacterium]